MKESRAPGFTAALPHSSSRWHWLAFLHVRPCTARDPVGLIDSLALGQEHFPTPHCLYKLIPQMMFIKSTSGEIFVFSTAWHLCGEGKRRGSEHVSGEREASRQGKLPGLCTDRVQSSEMICEAQPRRAEHQGVVYVSGMMTNTRQPGQYSLLMTLLSGMKPSIPQAGGFTAGVGLQETLCAGPRCGS